MLKGNGICQDCETEIGRYSTRCRPCSEADKKINPINIKDLNEELDKNIKPEHLVRGHITYQGYKMTSKEKK